MNDPVDPVDEGDLRRRNRIAFALIAAGSVLVLFLTVVVQVGASTDRSSRRAWAAASITISAILLTLLVAEIVRRFRDERVEARADRALLSMSQGSPSSPDDRSLPVVLTGITEEVARAVGASWATLVLDDQPGPASRVSTGPAPTPSDGSHQESHEQTFVGTSTETKSASARVAIGLTCESVRIGSLEVGAAADQSFHAADRLLLQVMAPRVAAHIERARLGEAERRARLEAEQARRRVNVLARASVPLAPGLENPEEAVTEIADIVVPEFADLFAVDLRRDGDRLERIVATYCDTELSSSFADLRSQFPGWEDTLRRVMVDGVSVLAFSVAGQDPPLDDDDHRALMLAIGLQSWVVAPIRVRGISVGTMTLGTRQGRRGYRPSDQTTIDDLVARTAVAFERALLYQEARQATSDASQRAEQLARMVEATTVITRTLKPQALLEALVEQAAYVLDAPHAHAELVEEEHSEAEFGPRLPDAVQISRPLVGRVGEEIGRLSVARSTRHPFVASDEAVITMLADSASVANRNALLYQDVADAQRFEAIASLAGGVAHDFNNLLTVILGYSDLLLHTIATDSPDREPVEAIQEAGNHAAVITNQLLTLSRHQVLQPEIIDAVARCAALMPMLRRLAGSAVTIDARLEGSAHISVDPGQLEQVLFNLVFNSRDAMPQGGHIDIEVGPHCDADGTETVIVRVSDDGEGMDAETLARCREPFFTTKGRSRGIGLGLATVASILERSGGTMEIDSEPSRGTSSSVVFPSLGATDRSVAPSIKPTQRRILLVDDEDQVRRFAERVLTEAGYQVIAVRDGESAITQAETDGAFELLVTDVILPKMTGSDVVRVVRSRWPDTTCVLVTGFADSQSLDKDLGETILVQKPFTAAALLDGVGAAMRTRRQTGQQVIERPGEQVAEADRAIDR